ncbi:MAG: hypothetical protein ACRC33_29385 [Gemmataceae bacterium]
MLTLTGLPFAFWRNVRAGTRQRPWLVRVIEENVRPDVKDVKAYPEEGAACGHKPEAGTCAKILEVEEALWTFGRVDGVEPANDPQAGKRTAPSGNGCDRSRHRLKVPAFGIEGR